MKANFSQVTSAYIGTGKEVLSPGKNPRVRELDANLWNIKLKKSESKNVHVYFDYLAQENHATITHQAVFNAHRVLYPQKK